MVPKYYHLCTMHRALCSMQKVLSLQVLEGGGHYVVPKYYHLCTMHCALCTLHKVLSLQVLEGGDGQGLRFACQAYLPSSPPISWISETDDGCFRKFLIGTRVDAGRARRPRRKEKRQIKISGCTEVSGPQLGICGSGGRNQISY